MKFTFLIITCILLFSAHTYDQDEQADDVVRTIEKNRREKSLVVKTYRNKTFVGSLEGYYAKNSIVMINSVTDAEAAGKETLYYLKNGGLRKVFIMAAQFDDSNEWPGYISKHRLVQDCHACHSQRDCIVTEITFNRDTTVEVTKQGQARPITINEKNRILAEVKNTAEVLKRMLDEL